MPSRYCAWPPSAQAGEDLREHYDVLTYRIDLDVDPAARRLSGTGFTHARVVRGPLAVVELDLAAEQRSGDGPARLPADRGRDIADCLHGEVSLYADLGLVRPRAAEHQEHPPHASLPVRPAETQ